MRARTKSQAPGAEASRRALSYRSALCPTAAAGHKRGTGVCSSTPLRPRVPSCQSEAVSLAHTFHGMTGPSIIHITLSQLHVTDTKMRVCPRGGGGVGSTGIGRRGAPFRQAISRGQSRHQAQAGTGGNLDFARSGTTPEDPTAVCVCSFHSRAELCEARRPGKASPRDDKDDGAIPRLWRSPHLARTTSCTGPPLEPSVSGGRRRVGVPRLLPRNIVEEPSELVDPPIRLSGYVR